MPTSTTRAIRISTVETAAAEESWSLWVRL